MLFLLYVALPVFTTSHFILLTFFRIYLSSQQLVLFLFYVALCFVLLGVSLCLPFSEFIYRQNSWCYSYLCGFFYEAFHFAYLFQNLSIVTTAGVKQRVVDVIYLNSSNRWLPLVLTSVAQFADNL